MSIAPGTTGACPHCKVHVRFEEAQVERMQQSVKLNSYLTISTESAKQIALQAASCPSCGMPILTTVYFYDYDESYREPMDTLLWPDTAARPIPPEVSEAAPELAEDFREAAVVFSKSKKASAALARRCLQFVLREKAGTKSRDLSRQIDEVLDQLPHELAQNLDAIRHIGNFAAHPMKSTVTGEIVQVEDGEAEWLLDVLEDLFDYYYVGPSRAASRRQLLNQKLAAIGKPELKEPSSRPKLPEESELGDTS